MRASEKLMATGSVLGLLNVWAIYAKFPNVHPLLAVATVVPAVLIFAGFHVRFRQDERPVKVTTIIIGGSDVPEALSGTAHGNDVLGECDLAHPQAR